jgi:hypothetical protein
MKDIVWNPIQQDKNSWPILGSSIRSNLHNISIYLSLFLF